MSADLVIKDGELTATAVHDGRGTWRIAVHHRSGTRMAAACIDGTPSCERAARGVMEAELAKASRRAVSCARENQAS